jgi:hypothetical protein
MIAVVSTKKEGKGMMSRAKMKEVMGKEER